METKRCKKCGGIYPADDLSCPSCGSKRQVKDGKKRSKMWLYPVLIVGLLILSVITAEVGLLGVAGLIMVIWFIVLFYRKVLKGGFAPVMREIEIDRNPVAARLLSYDGNSTTKAGVLRTAARGAVGGLLAGPVGFAVGVATTKRTTKTTGCSATFLVDYESGRQGTETVDVGSARFQTLYGLSERNSK